MAPPHGRIDFHADHHVQFLKDLGVVLEQTGLMGVLRHSKAPMGLVFELLPIKPRPAVITQQTAICRHLQARKLVNAGDVIQDLPSVGILMELGEVDWQCTDCLGG